MKHWLAGFAILMAACAVHGQTNPPVDPDYSNARCGNPTIESQGFSGYEGAVSKIVDGRTIEVALDKSEAEAEVPRILRVRLVALALDGRRSFSKRAKEHLGQTLLGKPVTVWASFEDKLPKKVTGTVALQEADIGLALLAEGWVRYQIPPSYRMSGYLACRYRAGRSPSTVRKAWRLAIGWSN